MEQLFFLNQVTYSSVGTEQEVHQYSHQISECTPNLAPHYKDEEIWWERWIKKRRLSSQREIWHSPLISLLVSPFALLSHRLRKSIPIAVSIPQNLPGYQRATFYTSYFIYENAWLNNNCFDHLATHETAPFQGFCTCKRLHYHLHFPTTESPFEFVSKRQGAHL